MVNMHAHARWFYDGVQWHRQRPDTYDPVRRLALPLCQETPLPGIHFSYELGQGRRCAVCQTQSVGRR